MVLCDTNIFIHAFNGNNDTIDRLHHIGLQDVVLSVITLMELYRGMNNKTEMAQIKKKITFYDVIEINNEISKRAANLIENFKLSNKLQIPDALIGATAVIFKIPLFTYNVRDFEFIPGIELI